MEKLTAETVDTKVKHKFKGLSVNEDNSITMVAYKGIDYEGSFINGVKRTVKVTEGTEYDALMVCVNNLFNATEFEPSAEE